MALQAGKTVWYQPAMCAKKRKSEAAARTCAFYRDVWLVTEWHVYYMCVCVASDYFARAFGEIFGIDSHSSSPTKPLDCGTEKGVATCPACVTLPLQRTKRKGIRQMLDHTKYRERHEESQNTELVKAVLLIFSLSSSASSYFERSKQLLRTGLRLDAVQATVSIKSVAHQLLNRAFSHRMSPDLLNSGLMNLVITLLPARPILSPIPHLDVASGAKRGQSNGHSTDPWC